MRVRLKQASIRCDILYIEYIQSSEGGRDKGRLFNLQFTVILKPKQQTRVAAQPSPFLYILCNIKYIQGGPARRYIIYNISGERLIALARFNII